MAVAGKYDAYCDLPFKKLFTLRLFMGGKSFNRSPKIKYLPIIVTQDQWLCLDGGGC